MRNFKSQAFLLFICLISIFSNLECKPVEKKKKHGVQLAVAAIFRNEAPYIKEWIEYYRLIGVEHFYLYNNGSSDDYYEVLKPYIKNKIVDLIEWPYEPNSWEAWDVVQKDAYKHALKRAKKARVQWLAFIDLDEFVLPVTTDNLAGFLKKFETKYCGGLCFMWSFFGTSHVAKIPDDQLMIETLVYHSGPAAGGFENEVWNMGAYKSIVRPKYVSELVSPHYCTYVSGKGHSMLPYDMARINHYWTRDEYYLENYKIPRRENWGQAAESVRAWADGMNNVTSNNPILRFVPVLRKKMGFSEMTAELY